MGGQRENTIEESVEMSMWAHERLYTGKTMSEICNDFQARFIRTLLL